MPIGTLISTASATIISVPTMALPKPPPCSSAAGGSWVNSGEAQPLAAAPEQHAARPRTAAPAQTSVMHGDERAQQEVEQRPRPPQRSLELREVDARERIGRSPLGGRRSSAIMPQLHA